MDFNGRYRIPAQPDTVWAALHDPAILAASIPGCEGVERTGDGFATLAAVPLGAATARVTCRFRLDEIVPPTGFTHAMTLKGEGRGGTGLAKGEAQVRLAAESGGTVLVYAGTVTMGGQLAQAGESEIGGTAKSLAGEFFAKLASLAQAPPPPPEAPPRIATPPARAAHNENGNGEEGLAPQIWIAGLIVIVIILLVFFGIVL